MSVCQTLLKGKNISTNNIVCCNQTESSWFNATGLLTRFLELSDRVGQGFWVYGIRGLFKLGIWYIAA